MSTILRADNQLNLSTIHMVFENRSYKTIPYGLVIQLTKTMKRTVIKWNFNTQSKTHLWDNYLQAAASGKFNLLLFSLCCN